jgi:hypothetical protein
MHQQEKFRYGRSNANPRKRTPGPDKLLVVASFLGADCEHCLGKPEDKLGDAKQYRGEAYDAIRPPAMRSRQPPGGAQQPAQGRGDLGGGQALGVHRVRVEQVGGLGLVVGEAVGVGRVRAEAFDQGALSVGECSRQRHGVVGLLQPGQVGVAGRGRQQLALEQVRPRAEPPDQEVVDAPAPAEKAAEAREVAAGQGLQVPAAGGRGVDVEGVMR